MSTYEDRAVVKLINFRYIRCPLQQKIYFISESFVIKKFILREILYFPSSI